MHDDPFSGCYIHIVGGSVTITVVTSRPSACTSPLLVLYNNVLKLEVDQ